MNRAELYEKIFKTILNNHADVFENANEVKDELDFNGFRGALLMASNCNISNTCFKKLIDSMRCYSNEEEINDYTGLTVRKSIYRKDSNKRNFIWHSNDFSVINCDQFFQPGSTYNDELLLGIEQICYNEDNRNDFLIYLKTNSDRGRNEFYVIYKPDSFPNEEDWKLYMYGLSLYLNAGKQLPSNDDLKYVSSTHHNSDFVYNNNAKYEQYIDIFDVISEWNNCSDILSAFLNMYQILEYMVYRKELVSIINGANIKQSFVRQVKGLDAKFTQKERDTFIKGLKDVLPSFKGKINVYNITAEVESFCQTYYPKTNGGTSYMTSASIQDERQVDNCIAKFIYDTRCSIVHNKESEFHITKINYTEYTAIVPLMKDILNIVGDSIFKVLNDNNNKISFSDSKLELY